MGDRISIQFAQHTDYGTVSKSAILYSHWGGMQFAEDAQEYVQNLLNDAVTDGDISPLSRLEPDAVMFNFVWHLGDYNKRHGTKRKSPLYTAVCDFRLTDGECDENNGHHLIWCDKKPCVEIPATVK